MTNDRRPGSPMATVVAVVALALLMFLVNRAGKPTEPAPAPVAAPAVTPATAPAYFTGGTTDGRVAVAVTVWPDRAEGHVAGKEVPLVAWLEGPVDAGSVTLGAADGVRLTGTVEGDRMRGTVWTGPGKGRPFSAVADQQPGGAGR